MQNLQNLHRENWGSCASLLRNLPAVRHFAACQVPSVLPLAFLATSHAAFTNNDDDIQKLCACSMRPRGLKPRVWVIAGCPSPWLEALHLFDEVCRLLQQSRNLMESIFSIFWADSGISDFRIFWILKICCRRPESSKSTAVRT